MQLAARPHIAAGVALVGAGIIAASPLAPPSPRIHAPAVRLTTAEDAIGQAGQEIIDLVSNPLSGAESLVSAAAASTAPVDPITAWLDTFEDTFNSASAIGTSWLADPFPVLTQLLSNFAGYGDTLSTALQNAGTALSNELTTVLPATLQTAFTDLSAGDITGAGNAISEFLVSGLVQVGLQVFPVLQIPVDITTTLNDAVTTLTQSALPLGLAIVYPLVGAITAFSDTAQAALDAFDAGDAVSGVTDILNIPATVTDAFLNGLSNGTPGLLSSDLGLVTVLLIDLPEDIAKSIAPAAEAAASVSGLADLANLGDVGSLFDPAGLTDFAAQLSSDLASLFDPSNLLSLLAF